MPEVASPLGHRPLDVSATRPFEGREKELALLDRRWKATESLQGGLLLISNGAEIGKTRLFEGLTRFPVGCSYRAAH